jgi:hypothetical protein
MISSVKELKYLRGLDSGEKIDAREKILNTASRVGLSAPQVSLIIKLYREEMMKLFLI